MSRSATDVVQDIINAAVVDAIVALKGASQGLPNALMRDLGSIHANAAFDDLPTTIQKAVAASVRNAFAQFQKDGYVIAEAKSVLRTTPRVDTNRSAAGAERAHRRSPPKPANRRGPPPGKTKR